MNTQQQTQEARDAVVAEWDHTKGNLAETPKNLDLMQRTLTAYCRKNGDFISVSILRAIVESLRPQLDWLAVAKPPAPANRPNDVWNKLASVGILKDGHQSHAEKQNALQAKVDLSRQILDDAATTRQRKDLKRRISEAEALTVTIPTGPLAGRVNHGATSEARARALASLRPELDQWNKNHPDQAIVS